MAVACPSIQERLYLNGAIVIDLFLSNTAVKHTKSRDEPWVTVTSHNSWLVFVSGDQAADKTCRVSNFALSLQIWDYPYKFGNQVTMFDLTQIIKISQIKLSNDSRSRRSGYNTFGKNNQDGAIHPTNLISRCAYNNLQ